MKPPIIRMPDNEPLQDRYHDGNGNYWSVARLIDDTKDLKPFSCPLASLDLSHELWKGSNMTMLAYHCKKVQEADLSIPIILDWEGGIADGRHRVIKAILEGRRVIKAVRMQWRPTPCETKEL